MKKLILSLSIILVGIVSFAQTEVTIYEIQGQQEHSPYNGQAVKTQGIVTGVYSGSYFIQDGAGAWNGVYVYSGDDVAVGDAIELTGTVEEYYDLTELKSISSLTILSSGNPLPAASVLSSWDVNDEAYEGVLVMVENAICTNNNLGFGEWELDDGTGSCVVDDMGVVYSATLGLSYSVTGPLNYSFDFYKIEPRDESDILIMENLYFTKDPEQFNPDKYLVTLQWETNIEATTQLFWGYTPGLEQGTVTLEGTRTVHEMQLPGLPSTIFYIRPFSVSEGDTTPYFIRPYATVSNSSGDVNLYFNHTVDNSVALFENATWTPNITDTVIYYLNMAQQSLDITMYEQESEEIVAAINSAYDRGVQVRYITDDEGRNPALEFLNENIPVLYGNTEAIMHDKFIIIDTDEDMESWVITGSLNHTEANLGWDYNNMICVQDKSMAMGFTLEFEEMWGSDGPMYDEENAKFGAEKTNDTPHKFRINEIPMEVYFSPSDGTTSKIQSAIDNAEKDIEFGIMVFTENSLGNAIIDAQERGLDIHGIIDYVEYTGSEYQYMKDNGVYVRDYVNPDGSQWPDGPVFHHKYAILDFMDGPEDAIAITGSHNWSASAESINDENTLIIHDINIANQFHQEFYQRFKELLTPVAVDDDTVAQTYEWITLNYLENDFIPEDILLGREIIVEPLNGEAGWVAGEMAYRSFEGFLGPDSLSYRLYNVDNTELSDTAWVRIEVGESGIGDLNPAGFITIINTALPGKIVLDIHSTERDNLQIKIVNINGHILVEENHLVTAGKNSIQLNLPSIARGVLVLDISGKKGSKTYKLVY
jgi:phosphatidylserine/phosphatidylglycerophosphate/cardiolipin synthase-like enzyme